MRINKFIILVVILFSSIYPQAKFKLNKIIELPLRFDEEKFHPTEFTVSPTGYYFLDKSDRQIAYLANSGNVIFAGGYGIENDAFIDPIKILSSKLRAWVIDRTENKLIEFDHKLNYLRTVKFDRIYPEFVGIDDWGNILLQSDQEHMIFKSNPSKTNFDEFIDLSIWNDLQHCVVDFHAAYDGTIGILADCKNSVYIFNRLGKLEKTIVSKSIKGNFLVKLSNEWYTVDTNGQIKSLLSDNQLILETSQPILDVVQMDGKLYLLFSDKIWIVDVATN